MDAFPSLALSLAKCEVAVCGGPFAGSQIPERWQVLQPDPHASTCSDQLANPRSAASPNYPESIRRAVMALAGWKADLLICIGGDGLSSYIADSLISSQQRIPVLGIGAGTANVGPIVTTGLEDLTRFDPENLEYEPVGAVEVCDEAGHRAFGFNDIVIGNSYLGTLDGKATSLSAEALLRDGTRRAIAASPKIAGPGFGIWKNGTRVMPRIARPAQIVVSPLGMTEFYGRAITGVLCNASYMRGAAAIALFEQVIVRPDSPEHGIDDLAISEQMLFGAGDVIEIRGLGSDGYIIADGNPFARNGDSVNFRTAESLIDVARIHERASLKSKGAR
ncbi:MAG: hypothetical protein LLF89_06170 [Spirochaetaceae bacterium]|nr:hypothetical protein [Spirochaetaceae bacterium]